MEKTERMALKDKAKSQIRGNLGVLFAVTIIIVSIMTALCSVAGIGDPINLLKSVPGSLFAAIVTPAFRVGVLLVYFDLVRGRELKATRLFDGFDVFGKAFLLGLLRGIFILLWSLLFIVPGCVKALSYSQSFYLLATHPELSASEALDESKRMMKGHKGELFLLELSFLGWRLVSALSLGIAYIYTGPYYHAVRFNYYEELYAKTRQA